MKKKLPPLKIPPIQNHPDPVELPKQHPNIPKNVKEKCGEEQSPQNSVPLWIWYTTSMLQNRFA